MNQTFADRIKCVNCKNKLEIIGIGGIYHKKTPDGYKTGYLCATCGNNSPPTTTKPSFIEMYIPKRTRISWLSKWADDIELQDLFASFDQMKAFATNYCYRVSYVEDLKRHRALELEKRGI